MGQRTFIHAKISYIIRPVVVLALRTNCIVKHSKIKQDNIFVLGGTVILK